MSVKLIKNEHGFLSVEDLPTKDGLEKHYSKKYYQEESVQYSHKYSDDELEYFKNAAKVAEHIYNNLFCCEDNKMLDVGCGEGFFANYFFHNNWNVTTLDYSSYGINHHNPALEETLIRGDIFESIDNLISQKNHFNLINLSNILEHVIDPTQLLKKIKSLLSNESLVRISVPNDYSPFQQFLLEREYTTNTWLSAPDHLHYFGFDSLSNLLFSLGYEVSVSMGEFPIELFLSNEASNYVKNRNHGKFAHRSRIEVDNFLFSRGIENYIDFYKSSARAELSRQIKIFAKIATEGNSCADR
jgi:2-polyprenyl-3-methyl-5-hydroxy-6-metoxy-1,4-benzoquinol methylase